MTRHTHGTYAVGRKPERFYLLTDQDLRGLDGVVGNSSLTESLTHVHSRTLRTPEDPEGTLSRTVFSETSNGKFLGVY